MEDEGLIDDDFIDDTAREYVGRYGADAAVVLLRQRAAIAEAAGATLLAQAWRDMAAAAEQLIG